MEKSAAQDQLNRSPEQLLKHFQDPVWGAGRLREISLFARFSDSELARIYGIGRLIKLKPKVNAVIEGEPTRGMYILLLGRVSVYKNDPATGNMSRLAMLEEGAHFGELSLFDNAPRSATVVAETDCFLFQLGAEVFAPFLQNATPDLQVRFYKTCAEDMAARFRKLNVDYISSQQLLWKYALRRSG